MAPQENLKKTEDVQFIELKAEFTDFADKEVVRKFQFRQPTPAEMDRATKETQKNPARGFKNLCQILVAPDQAESLKATIQEYPGIATTFADEIYTRMGYGSLGK